MLRLTLDQMRTSIGRLVAAGIAIVLGTAFITASFLATGLLQQAAYDAFTAPYAQADLVVGSTGEYYQSAESIAAIRSTAGVAAADLADSAWVEVRGRKATEYTDVLPTPSDPRLAVGTLRAGVDATADDEVVLTSRQAERLGVGLGDIVTLAWQRYGAAGSKSEDALPSSEETITVKVVGLLAPRNALSGIVGGTGDGARLTASMHNRILVDQAAKDEPVRYGSLLLALHNPGEVEQVRAALRALPELDGATIRTRTEIAEEASESVTGSTVAFLVVLQGFGAVAMTVASLVIANTFQVLIAQRTKTLALLRCVGASRAQIRGSVLLEAALLGLIASVGGLALGWAAAAIGIKVLASFLPELELTTTVPFPAWVPFITVGIGVVVTVLAALVPAKLATQVSPMAALRPAEGALEPAATRGRIWLSSALMGLGAVALIGAVAIGMAAASSAAALAALGLGVLGGILSLSGLLLGSIFVIPRLLPWLGRLIGRGVPGRIATANAVRNPRRTAATTNALVIGVGLVVMMSTGALSAEATMNKTLDKRYPVDVTSTANEGAIQPNQIDAVRQLEGVSAVITVRSASLSLETHGFSSSSVTVVAFAEGDVGSVLRDARLARPIADGEIVMDTRSQDVEEGSMVTLRDGETPLGQLRVVHADLGQSWMAYVSQATMATLQPDQPVNGVWAKLDDDADVANLLPELQQRLTDISSADPQAPLLRLEGSAGIRAALGQVINSMLLVVLGLLGVAVAISLVGVANTLSLSVLERRRENATLRALGLTRGQLRSMLAVEGVLIALMGTLMGVIAGLIYGWAGTAVVLGGTSVSNGGLSFAVPWLQLLAVLVIAMLAGLLASVIPARSATRQSPVAALSTS